MAAPPSEASSGSDAPSAASLLSLQYSKVEKPDEEDELKMIVTMQALHAQICPAVVQAAAALVAHCMQALKVGTASGECVLCTLFAFAQAPTKGLVSAQTAASACVKHSQIV